MNISKNLAYYLIVAGIFILLKFGYTITTNEHLAFLLRPTDQLVGLFTGSRSVCLPDKGFFHDKLNILIDKSCSGFNFWLLSFVVLAHLTIENLERPLQKKLSLLAVLTFAYVLTILVNASRIFVCVTLQNQPLDLFAEHQHLIHEAIGIITNLSFLILTYYFIEKLLLNRKHHAKLA